MNRSLHTLNTEGFTIAKPLLNFLLEIVVISTEGGVIDL